MVSNESPSLLLHILPLLFNPALWMQSVTVEKIMIKSQLERLFRHQNASIIFLLSGSGHWSSSEVKCASCVGTLSSGYRQRKIPSTFLQSPLLAGILGKPASSFAFAYGQRFSLAG